MKYFALGLSLFVSCECHAVFAPYTRLTSLGETGSTSGDDRYRAASVSSSTGGTDEGDSHAERLQVMLTPPISVAHLHRQLTPYAWPPARLSVDGPSPLTYLSSGLESSPRTGQEEAFGFMPPTETPPITEDILPLLGLRAPTFISDAFNARKLRDESMSGIDTAQIYAAYTECLLSDAYTETVTLAKIYMRVLDRLSDFGPSERVHYIGIAQVEMKVYRQQLILYKDVGMAGETYTNLNALIDSLEHYFDALAAIVDDDSASEYSEVVNVTSDSQYPAWINSGEDWQ